MFTYLKQSKNTFFKLILGVVFFQLIFLGFVKAQSQEDYQVDYKDNVIVDSDLDGLTDIGEIQIFKTDPNSPDSDNDGLLDGAEVLSQTDPLNSLDPVGGESAELVNAYLQKNTPWVWYFSRASGILAFVFLWLSVFYGLAIRNVLLRKISNPAFSLEMHSFFSISAVFWGLVHGLSFLFHDVGYFVDFRRIFIDTYSLKEILGVLSWGIGAILLGIMLIIVLTSYFRGKISPKIWRAIHFLNILVLPLLAAHVLWIGTDFQSQYIRIAFLVSLLFLVPLYTINMFWAIKLKIKSSKESVAKE